MPALERRFQKIIVQPPSVEETIEILNGLKPKYEEHHKCIYTDQAVHAAVTLVRSLYIRPLFAR